MTHTATSSSPKETTRMESALQKPSRINLLRIPAVEALARSRWPLFSVRALTLLGFIFTIFAGLAGSPVGSHNFAVIFVWLAWWTTLKLVFIPLGGRSWCSVCPIPMPGEWLQQGGLLVKSPRRFGLGLKWPKRLRGYWLQAGLFLLIGLFSALTLTSARLTALVLLGIMVLALVLSIIIERRAFCQYLCPIGGFTGIYAKTAPVELRVIDSAVCASHKQKTCYQECPWGLYPLALQDSSQCGLCMECLRVCPHENIALNLRPFGSDFDTPSRAKSRRSVGLDETFLALTMLGSVLVFAAVFTGPWGFLKSAALNIGSQQWLLYAAGFLALNLLALPAIFTSAVWLSRRMANSALPLQKEIGSQTQALLPLGLFSWIAFTVSFALPKFSNVLSVLSDPLGWGWDLIGTAHSTVAISNPAVSSLLQVTFLLIGLLWSMKLADKHNPGQTAGSLPASLPVQLFSLFFTFAIAWLLIG